MSIITKEKTTVNYFVRLENIPESTRKNKKNAVIKFQRFCKKHHNTIEELPERFFYYLVTLTHEKRV